MCSPLHGAEPSASVSGALKHTSISAARTKSTSHSGSWGGSNAPCSCSTGSKAWNCVGAAMPGSARASSVISSRRSSAPSNKAGKQGRIADAVPRCQQFVPPASTSSSPRSCSGTRPTSPTAMYGLAMHQAPIVQSHGDGRWRCGFGGGSAEVFFSMSFIIWISILVARELAPAVSLTSASRLGILRRGPFVVTNTDQKPRKVLLGPTAGSWRDRCSRSAGHSGHPRLHRAVAGVDRQLAKAEFHPYIRGGCYC